MDKESKIFILIIFLIGLVFLIQPDLHSFPVAETEVEEIVSDIIPAPLSFPIRIQIPAIDLDSQVLELKDEDLKVNSNRKLVIDPPTKTDVYWWSGAGQPGASSENGVTDFANSVDYTTLLYGHSTNNDKHKVVFDDIDELKIGDEIIITTNNGEFVYKVVPTDDGGDHIKIDKGAAAKDDEVRRDLVGRLVLFSCWKESPSNTRSTDNVIVIAELVQYKPLLE